MRTRNSLLQHTAKEAARELPISRLRKEGEFFANR